MSSRQGALQTPLVPIAEFGVQEGLEEVPIGDA
jgi:hypothetical protein